MIFSFFLKLDRAQSPQSRAAQNPHQNRFGLVIEIMADGDDVGFVFFSDFFKKVVADFAKIIL